MRKNTIGKSIAAAALVFGVSTPASAFFNPFGMMGSMFGQVAAPVTSQMIGQMLGAMQSLMHNNEFRNDMAQFALGVADEAIYETMASLQSGEATFVGALVETMLTEGAPRGSDQYNMAMGHWMEVFGPAMQRRMEEEQARSEAEAQAAADAQQPSEQALAQQERDRRFELGVFIEHGWYNWDTGEYDPDRLVYRDDNGTLVDYVPEIALPGDPT